MIRRVHLDVHKIRAHIIILCINIITHTSGVIRTRIVCTGLHCVVRPDKTQRGSDLGRPFPRTRTEDAVSSSSRGRHNHVQSRRINFIRIFPASLSKFSRFAPVDLNYRRVVAGGELRPFPRSGRTHFPNKRPERVRKSRSAGTSEEVTKYL